MRVIPIISCILILSIFFYKQNNNTRNVFHQCTEEVIQKNKDPILKGIIENGFFTFKSLPDDYLHNATYLREKLSDIDYHKQSIVNCFLTKNKNKNNKVILFTTGECSPTLWRLKDINSDIDLFKIHHATKQSIRSLKGRQKLTKESLLYSNVSYYAFYARENCINQRVFKRHENNNMIKGFIEKKLLTTSFNVLIKEGNAYHFIYNNSTQLHSNIDIEHSSHSYIKLKEKDLRNYYQLKLLYDKKILK